MVCRMYLLLFLTIACQNEDFKLFPHAQYNYAKSDRRKNIFLINYLNYEDNRHIVMKVTLTDANLKKRIYQ
jgi:hypothetical protein